MRHCAVWSKKECCVFLRTPCNRSTFRSRTDSVRSKSPLTASPASPGPLSNSLHGSFHGSLGSDGMSCSSARSSSASPDSARYSSSQVSTFIVILVTWCSEESKVQIWKYKIIRVRDKHPEYAKFKNPIISKDEETKT